MTRTPCSEVLAPVTVGTLRQALADGDRATQTWAIRSLGQLRDRESVDLLIAALEDSDDRVRRAAAAALAKLGDPRALDPLRRAHGEASGFTRMRIGRARAELESWGAKALREPLGVSLEVGLADEVTGADRLEDRSASARMGECCSSTAPV